MQHRQIDPAVTVASRDAHHERDLREVPRPLKDREHGEQPALPSRSHATPSKQVVRAIARDCCIGRDVEVVEEQEGRECEEEEWPGC